MSGILGRRETIKAAVEKRKEKYNIKIATHKNDDLVMKWTKIRAKNITYKKNINKEEIEKNEEESYKIRVFILCFSMGRGTSQVANTLYL